MTDSRCFERDGNEVINITPTNFEYYIGNHLADSGVVENYENDIIVMKMLGFVEVL